MFLFLYCLFASQTTAEQPPSNEETICFLRQNRDKFIAEGACDKLYPPCCSFNFLLALWAYKNGKLVDENTPVFKYVKGQHLDYVPAWQADQDPTSWIQNSCLWVSGELIKDGDLGLIEFVKEYSYGNTQFRHPNTDYDKRNGFWSNTGEGGKARIFWIDVLKISAEQYVHFLETYFDDLDKMLSSSDKNLQQIANSIYKIFHVQDARIPAGWRLYGKTGSANLRKEDLTRDETRQGGWYVGCLKHEKGSRLTFACHVEQSETPTSQNPAVIAKETIIKKALSVIKEVS